eukprot:g22818.t1
MDAFLRLMSALSANLSLPSLRFHSSTAPPAAVATGFSTAVAAANTALTRPTFRAVLFDLGGVVFPSPIHTINKWCTSRQIEPRAFNRFMSGAPSFHALERGELVLEDFYALFEAEAAQGGFADVDARALFAAMHQDTARMRPSYVSAIRLLRQHGYRVGALTNNWLHRPSARNQGNEPLSAHQTGTSLVSGLQGKLFDQVVQSCLVGLRKPHALLYQLAAARLQVRPEECVFLDDIGQNCKAARQLGFHTIKVVGDGDAALAELSALLSLPALRPTPPSSSPSSSSSSSSSSPSSSCPSSSSSSSSSILPALTATHPTWLSSSSSSLPFSLASSSSSSSSSSSESSLHSSLATVSFGLRRKSLL